MKQNLINRQKKVIQNIRGSFGCESSREKAIEKLNLMVDDYEKDNNTINKDNIHLYYEFMSDEELEKNRNLILSIFEERANFIVSTVNLPSKSVDYGYEGHFVLCIKDALQPIDDFIKEFKESKQYKEYLENKSEQKDI